MMLCFRGSDCRRSWGLTWYNKMDRLLMTIVFTKSKGIPTFASRLKVEDQWCSCYVSMHYFLGMEVWTREVCNRDPEEVQDDGLQGHVHTYCIKPEAIEWCFIRNGWCYDVSLDDWFIDIPDRYETRYLLYCEHIETCSPNGLSDTTVRCSLTWSDVSAWPFWCNWGIGSHLIKYKGWCHSLGEWRHLISYQKISV